ncbi:hypothetical protein ACGFSB_20515 [Streptomyces sp. NPDC048441]|uniref:hypothetical protein n=1 Tax=Streptomyces sp. NPDC048441 TaxID=3365552 RepID=UPI0037177706
MHPFRFERVHKSGVNIHRYTPGKQRAVTRNWPGLFQDWPEAATPFTEYAVNNDNMEEVAVYVGLMWRLTEGLSRYAIPAYYRQDAEWFLQQTPVLVDWEYEVEAEALTAASRDKGFVPGRSTHGARPGLTSWRAEDARRAGLFRLATPRDLVRMLRAVLLDASSEITLFAVAPGQARHAALVRALCGANRPNLADVLTDADVLAESDVLSGTGVPTEEDVFVDLTIGSDIGYYDSIMIASRADLRPRIETLVADYQNRITAYEGRAEDFPDMAAFLRAMRRLSGISLDAE